MLSTLDETAVTKEALTEDWKTYVDDKSSPITLLTSVHDKSSPITLLTSVHDKSSSITLLTSVHDNHLRSLPPLQPAKAGLTKQRLSRLYFKSHKCTTPRPIE